MKKWWLVLGIVVAALIVPFAMMGGGSNPGGFDRASRSGAEIVLDDENSERTCMVRDKTERVRAVRRFRVVWNVKNDCATSARVSLRDFTPRAPLDGVLAVEVAAGRRGHFSGVVRDDSLSPGEGSRTYPYRVYIGETAQDDPGIIIDR